LAVPIKQIAEVVLVVADLERSEKFYTEVLGLPVYMREAGKCVVVRKDHVTFGLWLSGQWTLRREGAPPITLDRGGRGHVVMYIDPADAEAAVANLRAHGVPFYGPRQTPTGVHIDFEDPDGHMLEFWARPDV